MPVLGSRFATSPLPLIVAVLLIAGSAHADDVLFGKGGALYRQPIDGEATQLVELPADARLQHAGNTLLVVSKAGYYTVDLAAATPSLRALVCFGEPTLAADGRISCASGTGGTLVYDPASGHRTVVAVDADGARLVGDRLLAGSSDAVIEVGLGDRQRRPLAPHRPDSALMIAPDGSRAVGLYPDGDATSVYGFRLDGVGARRKLISKTAPVAWSADSQWLLVQRGNRACIVRAVGGEYKCWKRYLARAVAADGSWALVVRERGDARDGEPRFDLYRAELAGARAARPRLVAEAVDGGAVWVSVPASAGSAP